MEQLLRQIKALEKRIERLEKFERPGVWADWTPTVTQSVSVAVTVVYARYMTVGKLAIVEARLAVTSAGTAGNAIVVGGQPAAIQHGNTNTAGSLIGTGLVVDVSGSYYSSSLASVGASDWRFWGYNITNYVGVQPNFALANGDFISFFAAYERA